MPARKTAPQPLYQFKITLKDIRPLIWRRIQVPGNARLCCLHDVLQIVMGWTNSHLHSFEKDQRCWSVPEWDEFGDLGFLDESQATLSALWSAEGDSAMYLYDFGDNWRHDVLLEKVLTAPGAGARPVCLGGERHCPPEDVGGVPGYAQFLEVIFDPKHGDHENLVRWAGGWFQPEDFDMTTVNDALAHLRWPVRHRRR